MTNTEDLKILGSQRAFRFHRGINHRALHKRDAISWKVAHPQECGFASIKWRLRHHLKMVTAHLFRYFMKIEIALSTWSYSSPTVFGSLNRNASASHMLWHQVENTINCAYDNTRKMPNMWHWINLYCFIWEVTPKTPASCIIRGSKILETKKKHSTTASCFHPFLGVWSPWWNIRTRF